MHFLPSAVALARRPHAPPVDPGADLLDLLTDPAWVYRQYDHQVQTNTVIGPGSDAAVLRVKGTKKAIAVTIDGKKYKLFTDGDTAWNRVAKDDAHMVRAMRVGKILVIEGVSSRGTKTSDTYSLFGFTAAHNAINKACKAP